MRALPSSIQSKSIGKVSLGEPALKLNDGGSSGEHPPSRGRITDQAKRKRLEAKGWKFGSAADFLGEKENTMSENVHEAFQATLNSIRGKSPC